MRFSNVAYVLLLATTGCEKNDPLFCEKNPGANGCERVDGGGNGDADADMMPDVPTRLCYGAGSYSFCLATPAQDALLYTATTDIDTDTSQICRTAPADWQTANNQPDACFVVGTVVKIPATLTVHGSKPLVIVSASSIEITGTLDVAGHRVGNIPGAGANGTFCMLGTDGGGNVDGGGGGAGGSFMGTGADGGDGAGLNNNGAAGTGETMAPTRLRAGCHGSAGGVGQGNTGAGPAGMGGGGVYLIAASEITFGDGAIINASGGGGGQPLREAGGGGGGSGGMIVLAAPMIMATGTAYIVANGGSGGAGADDTGGGSGVGGNDPDPTMPLVAAPGPAGTGGDGGAGAIQGTAAVAGLSGVLHQGGGGGGGALGYIQANRAITNVVTSPTITVVPDP